MSAPLGRASASLADRLLTAPEPVSLPRFGTDRAAAASPARRASPVPDRVWYAAYGSNLLRERFRCYLVGGTPPGGRHAQPPSDRPQEPGEDVPLVVPGRLVFAAEAPSWGGGGVAFWDPSGRGSTLLRGWLLDTDRFREVVHLENGGRKRTAAVVPPSLWVTGRARLPDGWYSQLLVLGELAGVPVVTFTSPEADRLPVAAPGPAYAGVVRRGLLEAFGPPRRGGLTGADADGYLAEAHGYRAGGSRSP